MMSLRAYARLTGGYWRGASAIPAWLLTASCASLIVLTIAVQFAVTEWNRFFFDALDRKNGPEIAMAIGLFAALLPVATAVAVGGLTARMRLQVSWRQWLATRLSEKWLGEQRFYRLSVSAPELDAPEFRIAEDARVGTEPVVDFAWGIASAVLTATVFFGVLWSAGGSLTVGGITIPGFMTIAAIVYCLAMSGSMLKLGYPLIARIETKNRAEAKLRQDLGRIRENAESIATIGGEAGETSLLAERTEFVADCCRAAISRLAGMTLLTNTNGMAAPVVPLLLLSHNYLTGAITLGGVMQTAAAFVQVQQALNWLVDNYARISEWSASANRVGGLWTALSDLDATAGSNGDASIVIAESADDRIHLQALSVARHDGLVMIDEADAIIEPSQKVLLMGESGTGKSTLIRAVAGLWPWGTGRILLPPNSRISFVPQAAYMPRGTLRQVLEYPARETPGDDATLIAAMTRCGLKRFIPRLDAIEEWDKVLSGGEQQRVAFTRLLIGRPDIVILDEATSALDTASQDSMMELFRDELAACTVISVGHRPELRDYHDRVLTLTRRDNGVVMTSRTGVAGHGGLGRLVRRIFGGRRSRSGA